MNDAWFIAEGGKGFGPFSLKQLRQMALGGVLSESDLLWKQHDTESRPASAVKGVFDVATISPIAEQATNRKPFNDEQSKQLAPVQELSTTDHIRKEATKKVQQFNSASNTDKAELPLDHARLPAKTLGVSAVACAILLVFATSFLFQEQIYTALVTVKAESEIEAVEQSNNAVTPADDSRETSSSSKTDGPKSGPESSSDADSKYNDVESTPSDPIKEDSRSASAASPIEPANEPNLLTETKQQNNSRLLSSEMDEIDHGIGHFFSFDRHSAPITAVAFSEDASIAFSGGNDRRVFAWKVSSGEVIWRQDAFDSPLTSILVSVDGRTVFACDQQNIRFLDSASGSVKKTVVLPIKAQSVSFSRDAGLALLLPTVQSGDDPAILFDPNKSKVIRKFQRKWGASHGRLSMDGRMVVCGEYHLDVHDLIAQSEFKDRIGQRGYFVGMDISLDGRYLTTGSGKLYTSQGNQLGNRLVRVWDLDTGREVCNHQDHREWVKAVKFLPARNMVLSAGGGTPEFYEGRGPNADNALRLFDLDSQRIVWTGEGHTASVWCLAISSNGKYALSGSHDGTVRVWRLPE